MVDIPYWHGWLDHAIFQKNLMQSQKKVLIKHSLQPEQKWKQVLEF